MNNQNTGEQLALLTVKNTNLIHQFEWSCLLAKSVGQDMIVLERKPGSDDFIEELELNAPEGSSKSATVLRLLEFIAASPELKAGRRPTDATDTETIYVRLKYVHFSNARSLCKLLLNDTVSEKLKTFTVFQTEMVGMDEDFKRERRLFFRYMPCRLVYCEGAESISSISRILVESTSSTNGRAALQFAGEIMNGLHCSMTALYINPDVGAVSADVGAKRLKRNLERTLGTDLAGIEARVEVDDRSHSGLRRVWEEGRHDLIVMGKHRKHFDISMSARLKAPVVTVTAASPLMNTALKVVEEGIQRVVPQMSRTDRVDLTDRLLSSASLNFDFMALMVLSTTIAAIGLLQNSAAVVIGAMLVAPLMTPLLGLGLALVQGNPVLARMSIRSVVFGVGISLLGGLVVGTLTPGYIEPTREMFARGSPGMLDLFVAYVSGLAAAYASTRSNLVAALPGVAIAAALVPPIATSGLALALGDLHMAFGALLIFIINMLTIVLASMTSLWAVGIRSVKKASRWMLLSGNSLLGLIVVLSLYLSLQPSEGELTQEIPPDLALHIQENLGTDYDLTSLSIAYDELGIQLLVGVEGDRPASAALAKQVRTVARDHYDRPVRVRLTTEIDIGNEHTNAVPLKAEDL